MAGSSFCVLLLNIMNIITQIIPINNERLVNSGCDKIQTLLFISFSQSNQIKDSEKVRTFSLQIFCQLTFRNVETIFIMNI